MAADRARGLAGAHPRAARRPRRHHRRHRGGPGPGPAGPGAAGCGRDRGRRPGLARGPRRAGLLGPAPGAGPGGRARAAGRRPRRAAGGTAHARAPVPHRGRAGPAPTPRPAGLGRQDQCADRRGRLRRRVPLRPGAGAGATGLGARAGRLRGQHVQDAGPRHAPRLADPAQPTARRPGRGQARQRPGQPRAAAARAGPADRERRARASISGWCASGSGADATPCSVRCASTCPRPASRGSRPDSICSSRSPGCLARTRNWRKRSCVPGCSSSRCPGTVSGLGNPGSCWGTPRTHRTSCTRPHGGSRGSSAD